MIQSIDSLLETTIDKSFGNCVLISVVVILTSFKTASAVIHFPDDAGIVNIAKSPYFAIPNGGKVDTGFLGG